jgi:hypothetical protein
MGLKAADAVSKSKRAALHKVNKARRQRELLFSDGVKPGSARAWKAQAEKSAGLVWLNWKKIQAWKA